jgi:uncharacterized RDD family membrane protein YckC
MKCPKCDYLGFETGDRCKNCGYDFSLISDDSASALPDIQIRELDHEPGTDLWLNQLDDSLAPAPAIDAKAPLQTDDDFFDLSLTPASVAPLVIEPVADVQPPPPEPVYEPEPQAPPSLAAQVPEPSAVAPRMTLIEKPAERPAAIAASAAATWAEPALPLFTPAGDDDDDAPLIKLPAAPRAPLAVRRTPDLPRLRAVPKPLSRPAPQPEPALAFTADTLTLDDEAPEADVRSTSRVWRGPASSGEPGSAGRRLAAAAIDHAILLSIDLVVVYFTLRMAALDISDWAMLPRAPMLLFLVLIKFAYFCAFTAIGGQTIGKMAARIRVVTDQEGELDGAQAARRTCAGIVSALTLGVGFLPGLFGDHRALHDRVAGTRVVGLESA